MRVFLGLSEIAGYYYSLHRALRGIGVETVYACGGHPFGYAEAAGSREPWAVRFFRRISMKRLVLPRPGPARRAVLKATHLLSRFVLLVWALAHCDVFVFGFGSHFLTPRELVLFRLFGKRTIHVFHGADNRPCYMDGAVSDPELMRNAPVVLRHHRRQHARVKVLEKYSDCLVSHPATAQYFQRPYINWLLATGIPFSREGAESSAPELSASRPVRILHCPSHRGVKGSDFICEFIGRLRAKGHRIEYMELTGRPNAEVLEQIQQSDFVIDQVYADYPMAGFAVEAAHFGKPALAGGYALEICRHITEGNGFPCDLYCLPEEMEELAERLIVDADFRSRCGAKAKAFVQSSWSQQTVAGNWLRLLKNDIPDTWFVNPEDVNYTDGAGLSMEGLSRAIAWFVHRAGEQILFMDHRPDLKAALLEKAARGGDVSRS